MFQSQCLSSERNSDTYQSDQIVAGWQHIFCLLGRHAKPQPRDLRTDGDQQRERTAVPFVALSPFGGTYFGPR